MSQAIPPKLNQLLESMPDVDRVSLLKIAHHYRMDLDDPGFLPLLLTQQGISALDKSKAEMVMEVERSLDLMAERITAAAADARKVETDFLTWHASECGDMVEKRAAEAETAMKQALAAWADRSIIVALDQAISSRAGAATIVAEATAKAAAETFAEATNEAIRATRSAADAVSAAAQEARDAAETVKQFNWVWLGLAFLAGAVAYATLPLLLRKLFS